MADKVEFYSQMAQFEAVNITQTYLNWSGFLAAAARFYKYPYDAQLMIYYQRPEATAVAPYDTWNIQMRRYIKRGSKGIAVLDNSGDAPKVQYLFDIADTGTRHNSRSPNQWKLLQEHEPILQSYLEKAYGIEREVGMLENQLEVLAMDLANRYWEDNSSQLIDILAGTHISEYDSFTQGANFRKALSNSILYQLIIRCFGNADDFLGEEDFEEVPDFDTPKAASALGTAVSTLSSQVLREIERAVRSYDRQKENERSNESYDRTDLYPNRGLPVPEHPIEGNRTEAPDQVRQDAQSVSTGTQPDPVQPAGADRTAVPAPVGDSGGRTAASGTDYERTADPEPGSKQGEQSDGLGSAHEQPESTGGGDRDEGAYLQLGFMMPTEAEQIQNIETQAESVQPSAFSIDDTEISRALKSGSGYSDGKLRIAAAFATIGEKKERADFLKKEYGTGGRSWDFLDGSRGFVDYDSKGILIKSWEYKLTVKLKWPEVEKRIGKLVESGEYLTAPEKERFAALEEEYAGRGGIPTPNPAFVYPPAQVEEFHSDNPRVDAMLNFAAQIAAENDYAEPQRFTMVDTADGHFQIRDSIHDGIYTEPDGTQRVFEDEESADQYMQEITEEAQRQSAEDWLALERAKLPTQALLSDAEFAQQYLIPGETQLEMEGRQFLIDRVNTDSNSVNMQDITFVQNAGFPIFRTEPISYVRRFVDIEPVTETEYTAETVAEYSSESTNLPYDIVVEKLHFDEPVQEPTVPAQNYHITDFNLGEGGAKAKFRMNMDAIHLLKELEQADRNATPEEQEVLSRYVGWGGLADAFDDSKSAWAAEYAELSAALPRKNMPLPVHPH